FPSAENETDTPCCDAPVLPKPTSLLPCWFQAPLDLVNIQVAPILLLSVFPPTAIVLPSLDIAPPIPTCAAPELPITVIFPPCCDQVPFVRVKTQNAPWLPLSLFPTTNNVFPSDDKHCC